MECPNCGEKIDDNLEICPMCDYKIEKPKGTYQSRKKKKKSHLPLIIILVIALFMISGGVYLLMGRGTNVAPTTEAPTTEAPTTEALTTEAPTTEAPTTEAPTTEAPTTEAPTTEAPTTEASTTEAPTTEAASGKTVPKKYRASFSNDQYIMPDADKKAYTKEEVASMTDTQLAYARNEICAAAGRKYKSSSKYGKYFKDFDWYDPTYDASYFDKHTDEIINEYQKKNLDLINAEEGRRGIA